MPSGIIYADDYSYTLQPGDTIECIVTAIEYDTDADVYVSYEVEDEDLIDCEWGDWDENYEELPLYITAGEHCGSTTLTVYLCTEDDDEVLDYDTVYVTVACGEILTDESYLDIGLGETAVLSMTAYSFDDRAVKIRYDLDDETLADCEWGTWDGDLITLTVHGLAAGSCPIRLSLIDTDTNETIASESVTLYVNAGALLCDNDSVMLAPGESVTVSITGYSYTPDQATTVVLDEVPSDVYTYELKSLGGNDYEVTITAKEEGFDYILVSLLDEDGEELNYGFIDVYVSADGKD